MTELSRLLLRPWRDSAFRILALALLVASLALTSVVLLRAELDARFSARGAEMLGGHLVLDSSRAPESAQREIFSTLRHSELIKFQSVVVHNEQVLLVSVKAVDQYWPLLGEVLLSDQRFGGAQTSVQHGPATGEVWVADQLLDRLGLQVGDALPLGQTSLRISAMLVREPDQGGGFYSMNPRVLMSRADLDSTGILAPGSRYGYDVAMLTDNPDTISEQLTPTLRPDQEIENVDDTLNRSMGPLKQLTLWVSLGVMLITVLCGAAIYLTTGLRVARRATMAALLRTFGASRQTIIRRLLGHELLAVLPVVLIGIGCGGLIAVSARNALGWEGALAAGTSEWLLVALGPLTLFAAFALPRMSALAAVPALQVLNRQSDQSLRRSGIELAAALIGPMAIAAILTGSIQDLLLVLLLLASLGVLLPALIWPLLVALDKRSQRWSVASRIAVRRLSRRRTTTLPLMAALTLAMAILALAGQSGTGLLSEWQRKLPANAPNHFILNLFAEDQPVLQEWQQRHGAIANPLYPIVRGRLTLINDVPVREAVTKENDRAERALNRDLALTEESRLPESNLVRDGEWHGKRRGEVSVEAELADSLGLKTGDRLTFVTSRSELHATVTSIREVDWESFAPNFYFMFSPGAFVEQDATWLTSFWLPEGDGRRVAELMAALPHITLLDVNAILERAQGIVTQASQATAVLAGLLVSAALLVLVAALLATADQRRADQSLLRALGARQALLRKVNWLEFVALGLGAAVGATLIVLAAMAPLGILLFNGQLLWSWWQCLPLLTGAGVALLGGLVGRRVAAGYRPAV
ncbi:MAG: ABC transporter permease [Alcanivoracaceae bacterium]|nr:ABC transporter permease [Alcanivoracaceae bacterium]